MDKKLALATIVIFLLAVPMASAGLFDFGKDYEEKKGDLEAIDIDLSDYGLEKKDVTDTFFTKLIKSEASVTEGTAIFEVNNIFNKPIPIGYDYKQYENSIASEEYYIRATETYYVDIPQYKEVWTCFNKTNCSYVSELTGYNKEERSKEIWDKVSAIPAKYKGQVKLIGKYNRNALGYTGVSIDWIPKIKLDTGLFDLFGTEFKAEKWAWWNASWGYYKIIYFNETQNLARADEVVHLNLTAPSGHITNCTNEIRVIYNNATEITSQVISGDDNSWCYIVFLANATANTNDQGNYSVYYGNAGASAPSYMDLIDVNTAGDDTIIATGTTGYNASMNMNGGAVNSFQIDNNTEILDETHKELNRVIANTTGEIFGHTESDDLCVLTYDGVLEAKYICDSQEDGNANGVCESGETCVDWYFNPNSVDADLTYSIAETYKVVQIAIDESVDGNWYYDSTNTPLQTYVVVSNGYVVNAMTTTKEVFVLWDEDIQNATEIWFVQSASADAHQVGTVNGDYYRFTAASRSVRWQVDGQAGNLNTEGQNWEKKFDNPLEDNYCLSGEASGSINITLNSPADNTITPNTWAVFNCSATGASNLTLHIWNGTGLYYNFTNSTGGQIAHNTTLTETSFSWNCLANGANWAISNYSLTVDFTPPVISWTDNIVYPAWNGTVPYTITDATATTQNITFNESIILDIIYISGYKGWNTARSACTSSYKDLAIVRSQEQNDYMQGLIGTDAWIGLARSGTWATGAYWYDWPNYNYSHHFTNWDAGEPDNAGTVAYMKTATGKWADGNNHHTLCEDWVNNETNISASNQKLNFAYVGTVTATITAQDSAGNTANSTHTLIIDAPNYYYASNTTNLNTWLINASGYIQLSTGELNEINYTNLTRNGTHTASKQHYATASFSEANDNSTLYINKTYYLEKAGLTIYNVTDEVNGSALTFNVTITNFINSTSANNVNSYLGNTSDGLPTGEDTEVQIRSSGYQLRKYYEDITVNSRLYRQYYLLNTNDGIIVRFHVKNSFDQEISGASVVAQKFINGNWTTVASGITDDSGTATMFLNPETSYHIVTTWQSYTDTRTITPTSNDYYITLATGGEVMFVQALGGVWYELSPGYNRIDIDNATWQGHINWTVGGSGLASNNSVRLRIYNQSGDLIYDQSNGTSTGGKITSIFSISNQSANYDAIQVVAQLTKVGYDTWTLNKTYYLIIPGSAGQYSIFNILQNNTSNMSSLSKFILALFISLFITAFAIKLVGAGGGFVVLVMLGFFTYLSWFDVKLYLVVCMAFVGVIVLFRR